MYMNANIYIQKEKCMYMCVYVGSGAAMVWSSFTEIRTFATGSSHFGVDSEWFAWFAI
jgi:hypothetical protein